VSEGSPYARSYDIPCLDSDRLIGGEQIGLALDSGGMLPLSISGRESAA
jgi:hypothetical protein